MNAYVKWLLRLSLVSMPLALLMSWHYEERLSELTRHVLEVDRDFPTPGDSHYYMIQMHATLELARDAALFWGRLFHLSVGAFAGTASFSLIRRRKHLAASLGLPESIALLRQRQRRAHLLRVRHPSRYAEIFSGYATILMMSTLAFAVVGGNSDSAYGISAVAMIMYACATLSCGLATVLLFRSLLLSTRTPGNFGDAVRLVIVLILIVVNLVGWVGLGAAAKL
jgi:hypothetical protein